MKHYPGIALFFTMVLFCWGCKSGVEKKTDRASVLETAPYKALTDSIRQFPNEGILYFERAMLLSQHNLHEMATPDYKQSWEKTPNELTAIQYASNLSITNKTAEALQLLQTGVQQFPDSRELKRILGETYVQFGNNKEALELYNTILKNDSSDFEAWYEKGELLAKTKDTTNAIRALQNAFTLQPISTYALELAHLYAETNNAAALALCDKVISKDSARDLTDPFFIKGIYYSNTQQYEKATIQYDSCIRRDWKFTEAYIEKGIVLFKQKNYDVAMNTFRMAATVSNTDPDAYYWIGRCYEIIHKKQEAIEYYERAASLDRDFTEAREAIKRLKS